MLNEKQIVTIIGKYNALTQVYIVHYLGTGVVHYLGTGVVHYLGTRVVHYLGTGPKAFISVVQRFGKGLEISISIVHFTLPQ